MPSRERSERDGNDDALPGPRTKRAKYAAVACDLCKKRKIKCQLEADATRCGRCKDQDVECIFSTSEVSSALPPQSSTTGVNRDGNVENRLAVLEGRFHALQTAFSQHCLAAAEIATPCSAPGDAHGNIEVEQPTSRHHQPHFLGPTRPAYAFNIARATLQGDTAAVDDPAFSSPPSPTPSTRGNVSRTSILITDPLRRLSKDEVLRLLTIYTEEISPVYPLFDAATLTSQTQIHFDSWLTSPNPKSSMGGMDISLVRLGVAIGNLVDCIDENGFSQHLVSQVEAEAARNYTFSAMSCRETVILATLSIYYFHADQEMLAWRRIGTAARAALELGLHKKNGILNKMSDDGNRKWVVRLFWCIYILDRRWSIGLSLPFTIQDADIDTEMLQLDHDAEYLKCMIKYGQICSKLWQSYPSLGSSAQSLSEETISYLEFQIEGWAKSIPKDLRLGSVQEIPGSGAPPADKTTQKLCVILHLRKNHLRMLINRHCVQNHVRVQENLEAAQSLVETAEDTISLLVRLNETGVTYIRQQAVYNHFLMTALTIVFLAVCHAPSDFRHRCRPAFDNAIRLVRASADKGSNSRRLWKTIHSLLPHAKAFYADFCLPNDEGRSRTAFLSANGTSDNAAMERLHVPRGTQPPSRQSRTASRTPAPFISSTGVSQEVRPDSSINLPHENFGHYGPFNEGIRAVAPTSTPSNDITDITNSLTEFYSSLDTSNFDSYISNFNQDTRDYLMEAPGWERLSHDPFRAV